MFRRKIVLRSNKKWHPLNFRGPFFRIWSRLGPQDGPMLEAKMDPTSIKNRCEKRWIFEGLLEGHNFEKSSILEANMEASWHQNRSRNRCYLRKALKKKLHFSFRKNSLFWDPGARSWEEKSMKNRCENRCGNRKPWKLDFDRFLIDLGAILALQNGAKTLKNRCWKGIKIWSVFKGLLERDFFGPRAAKRRQRRRSPQKMESARAYWDRI